MKTLKFIAMILMVLIALPLFVIASIAVGEDIFKWWDDRKYKKWLKKNPGRSRAAMRAETTNVDDFINEVLSTR